MKKILILMFVFISTLLGASSKLSSIPPVQNVFIDLDIETCDEECLNEMLENEQYFSFLSKYNANVSDEHLKERFTDLNLDLRMDAQIDAKPIKLAMLVPQKKIRRYAISTVNSVNAYLIYRNHKYELQIFNTINENSDAIYQALDKIKQEGFEYVIAPVTKEGAKHIIEYAQNLTIFIPTVNKSSFLDAPSNIFFGGIDYLKQIDSLSNFANSNIATFSDGSTLGKDLDSMVKKVTNQVRYSKEISNSKVNFKSILRRNSKLRDSSIYLNMPLVKSSLLASQLRVYNINTHVLLSTQINYHPMLLTLTQYGDRKDMFIGNAINYVPPKLRNINEFFGHSIEYDWVNYATSIGIDYLYTHFFNPGSTPIFKEMMRGNQIEYKTTIMKPSRYRFYRLP